MVAVSDIIIDIDDLASTVEEELELYEKNVMEVINEGAKKTAKKASSKLKVVSPKKTQKYARSWRYKLDSFSFGEASYAVYNSTKPGLTHLLEFGHANRNGGRTKAYPHIKQVYDEAKREFEEIVWRAL